MDPARHTIKTFHSSGRWDRSPKLLEDNVRRMRRHGRSIGTRTEIGHPRLAAVLEQHDGWRHFHPHTEHGLADCSVEWDSDVWKRLRTYALPLTSIRVRTTRGFLLPPTYLVCALLEHRATGTELLVGVTHRNLRNTWLRRRARAAEARTLRAFTLHQRRTHPDREVLLQYDENANQRLRVNRGTLWATVQRGTGLRNLWVGHLPAKGGTHGRSLLDVTLSTMAGGSYLLPDDTSSDHRPYGSTVTL